MILNGAGDPRTLSPIPDGTNDKVYVDDLTGAVYSAVGFPPTWTPVPSVMASLDLTAQAANVSSQTFFTPATTGMYEIAAYLVVTQAATTSSTLPQAVLQWTDPDANTTTPLSNVTATYGGNALGGTSMATGANSRIIRAKAGTAVLISTTGYASSGATAMQYAVHVRAIQISS